jgi:hypothetical protein
MGSRQARPAKIAQVTSALWRDARRSRTPSAAPRMWRGTDRWTAATIGRPGQCRRSRTVRQARRDWAGCRRFGARVVGRLGLTACRWVWCGASAMWHPGTRDARFWSWRCTFPATRPRTPRYERLKGRCAPEPAHRVPLDAGTSRDHPRPGSKAQAHLVESRTLLRRPFSRSAAEARPAAPTPARSCPARPGRRTRFRRVRRSHARRPGADCTGAASFAGWAKAPRPGLGIPGR